MTLIEIIVVLAIIGMLTAALVVGYGRVPSTALKREAVHLAAVLRSGYDRATTSGAHHRLVFDLDANSYRLERCEGKVEVRRSRDLKEEQDYQKDQAEKAARAADAVGPDALFANLSAKASDSVGGSGGASAAKCEPVTGEMGKPYTLGERPKVSLSRIWVAHLADPTRSGKVTLNFFPLGTAEKAVIVLAVDDDNVFSLAVQPLSGRIDMQQGEMRRAEDFMTTDATGTRQVVQ